MVSLQSGNSQKLLHSKKVNLKAYTLAEIVVSLGIIGIIITIFFNVLIVSLKITFKNIARSSTREEITTVTNLISKDLRNAIVVSDCGQTAVSEYCELVVDNEEVRWEKCSSDPERICKVDVESGNVVYQSDENFKLTTLTFENSFSDTSSNVSQKVILLTLVADHVNPDTNVNNVVRQTAISTRNYELHAGTSIIDPSTSLCGNGVKEAGEECDDGNSVATDACNNSCRITDRCGNGLIEVGEPCDDGNSINTDACTNACALARCGDGYTQSGRGEQCDDGNTNDFDNCKNTCTFPICGDGVKNGTEQCDDGNSNNLDACTTACLNARCGDGHIQTSNNEQCDDANTNDNDSCSNTCRAMHSFQGSSFAYKRQYTVNNPQTVQTNFDLLFTVNTQELIAAGQMQADCGDIRFSNSAGTNLNYYIESGCNTVTTQVWARIPSLVTGNNTVFMYYGNASIANGTMNWAGSNTLIGMFNNSCPIGWTTNATLNARRFPLGSIAPGSTGGATTHDHFYPASITSQFYSTYVWAKQGGDWRAVGAPHLHGMGGQNVDAASNYPAYRDVIFCNYNIANGIPNTVPTNYIGLLEALPGGWARDASFDSRYPLGHTVSGGVGGSNTHVHTESSTTGWNDYAQGIQSGADGQMSQHFHYYSFTTNAAASYPPYYTMLFANPSSDTLLPQGGITGIFTGASLPPLGWTAHPVLNGGYIPFGSATPGIANAGVLNQHTHYYTGNTGINIDYYGIAGVIPNVNPATGIAWYAVHTHTFSGYTGTVNGTAMPPYLGVYYGRRSNDFTSKSFTMVLAMDPEGLEFDEVLANLIQWKELVSTPEYINLELVASGDIRKKTKGKETNS